MFILYTYLIDVAHVPSLKCAIQISFVGISVLPLLYIYKSDQVLHHHGAFVFIFGQFHMSGVKIQIFENRLHMYMKLYPVLHCRQVKVRRKINISSLMTTI